MHTPPQTLYSTHCTVPGTHAHPMVEHTTQSATGAHRATHARQGHPRPPGPPTQDSPGGKAQASAAHPLRGKRGGDEGGEAARVSTSILGAG
jgi:hypothetical protein